MYAVFHFFCEL